MFKKPDTILNKSIYPNNVNTYNNQNEAVPKPSQTIDSILSMDDTILGNLEDNFDSNNVVKQVHNVLANEWNICDTSKTQDIFEQDEKLHFSNVEMPETEYGSRDALTTINCASDKDAIQWQDNTFLNEVFTQCDSPNGQNFSFEDNMVQGEQMPSMKGKYEEHFTLPKEIFMSFSDVIPTKKNCLSNQKIERERISLDDTISSNNCTFYGLPIMVQELIFKIKGISQLYQWQDECLNLQAIKQRKNLIYALPTSGGKTLVAEILMLRELLCNKKNAVFILPFVAIVQEKVQSMAPFALELGFLVEEYAATRGSYPPKKRKKKNSIYICTIEKAVGLIHSLIEEKRLNEIGIIVVDELHLLGEGGGRGASLEGLLTKVLYVNEGVHIVGMSATIGNLDEIAQFLKADLYTGNFRPVEIKEYVKCDDNIWLIDLKADDLLTDLKKINYRYSDDAAIIDPDRIAGLVMDIMPNDSCLVFCSSRKNCENVALLLCKVLFRSLENHKKNEKQKLLNALRTEEGLCPILSKTIKIGVAYHHSGLTSEERRLLEDAFRAGTLSVICCTSTLAAGVNLPARRVILRSPYVGNQFLNISRYKQMVGRAGRAGMQDTGESILICKRHELPKVKNLLISKMDDSLSTMHTEKDRGINSLILSAALLSIAKTRSELHNLATKTLLNIQQKRLNVDVKTVLDDALTEFLKYGVIKVKKQENLDTSQLNLTVAIPSQHMDTEKKSAEGKAKKVVVLTSETELELCDLGRAALKGCIDMQCAHTLYKDLKTAQKHLILIDYLHLLYLVTPYDIVSQVKPVGTVYYDVITKLSEKQMHTARLLGINEVAAIKLRDGFKPKNVEPRIIQRFYVTLLLHDLWNHHAVYVMAEKYQISRGIIQNLLTAVSSFALSVVRFCEELDEFWAFRDLLKAFSKKLSYCCPMELEVLMELPLVKIGRARQLYNAGYRTVQCIAKAKPADLQEKIPYLGKRAVIQIIEAAKLSIVEKMENLKDEAEDVLDGIDLRSLKSEASQFVNLL